MLWENPDEKDIAKRIPLTTDGTTALLLRDLLISLQGDVLRRLQKSEDSHRAHKLWNVLENTLKDTLGGEDGKSSARPISLRESEHSWLYRVLRRKVPITKDGKDSGLEERSVAQVMWGLNEFVIRQLLKCLTPEEVSDIKKEMEEEEKPAHLVATEDER